MCTEVVRCGIGKLQESNIGITGFIAVGIHSFCDSKSQIITKHAVSPYDMRRFIVLSEHLQKINDSLFKLQKVFPVIGAVWILALLADFTGFRNGERGLFKSTGIIGTQIYYNSVRHPATEIVGFGYTEGFVEFSAAQTTQGFIAGRDIVPCIVVPAAVNSPATLGKEMIVSIQGIGSHDGIIPAAAHIHGKPVRILFGTIGTFTGGDAVSDKFYFITLFRGWKEKAICLKAFYKDVAVIVFCHGLQLTHEFHVFDTVRTHIAEQTDGIGTGQKHLAAHKGIIQCCIDPGLVEITVYL